MWSYLPMTIYVSTWVATSVFSGLKFSLKTFKIWFTISKCIRLKILDQIIIKFCLLLCFSDSKDLRSIIVNLHSKIILKKHGSCQCNRRWCSYILPILEVDLNSWIIDHQNQNEKRTNRFQMSISFRFSPLYPPRSLKFFSLQSEGIGQKNWF